MANTTNYSWETPDDTDLVKDGAAAIRTLGSSIDTTTKALNPSTTLGDIEYRSSTANTNTRLGIGTSGQALTVVAGVPSWAASPTSVLTTTGDVLYASAANTLARLGIGSTGNVLTVSGGVPSWAAPAGGSAPTLASIASGSLSGNSLTISSLSSYDTLILKVYNASDATESQDVLQINSSGSSVYDYITIGGTNTASFSNGAFKSNYSSNDTSFNLAATDESITSTGNQYTITLTNCKSTGFTYATWVSSIFYNDGGTNRKGILTGEGLFKSAAAVSSLKFFPVSTSTYDAGTYELFGG